MSCRLKTLVQFSYPHLAEYQFIREHAHESLIIKDIDGVFLDAIEPPPSGWTVAELQRLEVSDQRNDFGYDVFFADRWFGSSEM